MTSTPGPYVQGLILLFRRMRRSSIRERRKVEGEAAGDIVGVVGNGVAAASVAGANPSAAAAAPDAPGSWEEDMEVDARDPGNPANKFKPGIKFKLQQ